MLGITGVGCISSKTMPPFTLRYGYILHREPVANDAPESKAHLIKGFLTLRSTSTHRFCSFLSGHSSQEAQDRAFWVRENVLSWVL